MDARIDRVTPRGGHGCNTWLVGDTDEVIVVDPGDDAGAVLAAISDREIIAVICTHGHPGHVAAALEVSARDEAAVALHRRDVLAWREAHPGREPELLTLPEETRVLPGHGEEITVGTAGKLFDSWVTDGPRTG